MCRWHAVVRCRGPGVGVGGRPTPSTAPPPGTGLCGIPVLAHYRHERSQPDPKDPSQFMENQKYSPLGMVPQRRCSWSCRGTPRVSWRSEGSPFRSQCRHLVSESAESLVSNHSFPIPSEPHQVRSPRARRLPCNGPLPSCFLPRTGQTQSCQGGTPAQRAQTGWSPLSLAPSQWG